MSWMQHRQTSELGRSDPRGKISTIGEADRGAFALRSPMENVLAKNDTLPSLGILSLIPKSLVEEFGGDTRQHPPNSWNSLIEHEDAPPDIYGASGPS
jgi:hypothetical protein